MKAITCLFFITLTLLAGVYQACAELPVITSFTQDGVLICSNLPSGSLASVQWASSPTGPWQTNWASLSSVTVASNGTIQVSVPMFYRVQGVVTPDGMVPIPAGTFTMGDVSDTNLNGDAAPTVISVSGFYMDQNLVSFSQWQGVYSYATNQGYSFADPGLGQAANHPVQSVDWFDCVKWSNARSRQTGLTPVYYTDAGFTQVFTNGDSGATIYANWSANGYRLPTEAEWELAARGGLSGQRFPWGNTISWSQANYYGDPLSVDTNNGFFYDLATAKDYDPAFSGGDNGNIPYTSPVGSFPSNNYGLNDMAGNVFEWCWDWYGTPYGLPTTTNPTGPATGGVRVLRGGSWGFNAISARCANRGVNPPSNSPSYFGFRCVKGL